MSINEAIEICEDLFASEDGSHRAKAIRVVLDELQRLRQTTKPASESSAWVQRDCEHEELPSNAPDDTIKSMTRRRRADGWELHPTVECNGRLTTYIFTRPKR